MSTMTVTNDWTGPIAITEQSCVRVQCRHGGPVLICTEEPTSEDDGYLLKEGESRQYLHSTGYPSLWIKSRTPGRTSDIYLGGETLQG